MSSLPSPSLPCKVCYLLSLHEPQKTLPQQICRTLCKQNNKTQCISTYAKILRLVPLYRKCLLQLCQILPYVCNLCKFIALSHSYIIFNNVNDSLIHQCNSRTVNKPPYHSLNLNPGIATSKILPLNVIKNGFLIYVSNKSMYNTCVIVILMNIPLFLMIHCYLNSRMVNKPYFRLVLDSLPESGTNLC